MIEESQPGTHLSSPRPIEIQRNVNIGLGGTPVDSNLSATLSFIAGLVVNYIISCIWVFNNSKFRNRIVEFLFFAAIGVVGLGFNDLLIWLFTDCIGTHYMFSKIVAAAMVYLWNFFARKYLVFK